MKQFVVYGLIVIIAIIFGSLVYIQNESNEEIKESLLNREIRHQETVSAHFVSMVENDLNRIVMNNQVGTQLDFIQNEDYGNPTVPLVRIMDETMQSINPKIQWGVVDKNGLIVINSNSNPIPNSFDFSVLESDINKIQETSKFVLSEGFTDSLGQFHIAILEPIINNHSGDFQGYMLVMFPVEEFFSKYHELGKIDMPYIGIADKSGIILRSALGNEKIVGINFLDERLLSIFDDRDSVVEYAKRVIFDSYTGSLIMQIQGEEHSGTARPVSVYGSQVFSVWLLTPTSLIFAQAQEIHQSNLILTISLIIGVATTIMVLLLFLRQLTQHQHELKIKNIKNDLDLAKKEKFVVLGQLAANIAHDIRNPLTTLKNSMYFIQKSPNIHTLQKELPRIDRSINRITHQVDDVLEYVGFSPLQFTKKSIREILISSYNSTPITENIIVNFSDNDIKIECDDKKLERVFANILLNAVQAIGSDKGRIDVKMSDKDDRIEIDFENSGPNIDEKNLDKIFEPLFTTKMQGTGLGLAGCKNIVNLHGGIISVTNNPTTFTINMPKRQNQNKIEKTMPQSAQVSELPARTYRIR